MNVLQVIEKAKDKALDDQLIDRQTIIKLLEIDPYSEYADKLGESARKVAEKVTENRGKIWASIGVDYQPCKMNCNFCSFGKRWGKTKQSYSWSDDEIIRFVKKFVKEGAEWITLRTTEHYGIDKLCLLGIKVKKTVHGKYKLVANTGEVNAKEARLLEQSGFEILYHSIRLREGIDTPFNVNERCKTLEVAENSSLNLAYLVEPVGIEHSNEELADMFLLAIEYGAKLSGAMARIPILGTPLFKYGKLPERRLAQIVAVTRIAAGFKAPDICVHPPSQLGMEWGANVVVVDVGAVPRDSNNLHKEWNDFDLSMAKSWFNKSGYQVRE